MRSAGKENQEVTCQDLFCRGILKCQYFDLLYRVRVSEMIWQISFRVLKSIWVWYDEENNLHSSVENGGMLSVRRAS